MGLDLPASKVLDVVGWQQRPPVRDGALHNERYNLQDFCALQGFKHLGAHNAGNDARALLEGVLLGLGVLGPPVEIREVSGEGISDSQSG